MKTGGSLRIPAIYIACAILFLSAPMANGATIQVSSNLQAAIDAAAPGDTLQVAPSIYDKIEITKRVNLVGNGATIRANDRDACVRVLSDGVTISGFVVRDGFYGISLENVKDCNISRNTVTHCAQPGIMLKFSIHNLIQGNNASFNGLGGEGWYGIYLTNSNDNLILANVASNNGAYGINLFPSCNNNTIKGNTLAGNMYGLYMFTDCSSNLIESNIMSRNSNSGLDMRFNCHDNLILNNTIEDNVVAGITLMDSGNNTIKGNEIQGNGRYGLQVQSGANNNTILTNTITESRTGIFLESSRNQIYSNRILDNVVQAEDRGQNTWNAPYAVGGNLWSDYIGEDSMSGPDQDLPGKDHFGDTPYKINDKSEDRYPIMGNQVKQIKIVDKSISPSKARVGDNINIRAKMESKYGLSQVSAHAFSPDGVEAKAYCRMSLSGDFYEGSMSTALMDPGRYGVVLSAKDLRGYELKETLGEIELIPRGNGRFVSSLSKIK